MSDLPVKNRMRLILRIILLGLFGSTLCIPVGSATANKWIKTYEGTGADYFSSVIQTSDGGYVAAG